MANQYFDPGEQRAAKVAALFARIAPRYDLINDLQSFGLHRYWKRRLVRLSGAQPGRRALDVCCGTGDLALAMAQRGAEVTGLDFSREMLAVAEARCLNTKHQTPNTNAQAPIAETNPQSATRNPQFLVADAQHLPLPDGCFDIVTVGYGLRNLADWRAGLGEMQRVAKPGGRLLVLDFGKPNNRLWRALYFGYLRLFVPLLGKVFCGDAGAYAYILESLQHYPAQQGVAARMRELGLKQVRIIHLLGGVMTINYAEKP